MAKIKVGICGCGSISNVHLSGYAAAADRAEVYAVCDIDRKKAESHAKRLGIPEERIFTDINEMVKLKELDAVDVCTWNSAHAPCTIAALNAGKNVMCEKPMALNAEDAQAMADAAKKAGKLLMVGFVRRYGNDCDVMMNLKDDGYFGDFYYAKAIYTRRNGCPGGWFSDKARSGGGPVIDLGVHVIDLVRYIMGNPLPVSVYGATFCKLGNRPGIRKTTHYSATDVSANDIFNVEDSATALVRFDNGAVLNVEAAFTLNQKHDEGSISFFGTKAGAKIDPELELFSSQSGYLTNTQLDFPTALSFDGLFEKEIGHFVDCIINGTPCKSPAEDGVVLMKILDAIYESAKTGHEVIIK